MREIRISRMFLWTLRLGKMQDTHSSPVLARRPRKARKPLPECPICNGSGSMLLNVYGPCGQKENTQLIAARCACLQIKRRGNPNPYDDLRRLRAAMIAKEQSSGARACPSQPEPVKAVAYMRTSSAINVGPDKDSEKRQRAGIENFAQATRMTIVDWFYDAAVSGSDPIHERPGFKAMLERIAGNGVCCIIVESPDRFARDLAVQLAGHDYLKALGIMLIPASAPDFFTEETPTAVLVRQVLGAISQFEKATIVAKLKAARDRKRAATGRCGGNRSRAETRPDVVALAKRLRCTRSGRQRSLREISAELAARGFVTAKTGRPFAAAQVGRMLEEDTR